MKTLDYIYGVILHVLNNKISVAKALEMIRAALSELDKESYRNNNVS